MGLELKAWNLYLFPSDLQYENLAGYVVAVKFVQYIQTDQTCTINRYWIRFIQTQAKGNWNSKHEAYNCSYTNCNLKILQDIM